MKLLSKRRKLNNATASPADTAGLASLGPAAVENMPRHIKVGDGYAATLIVTGYPAEVGGAWLDPLLAWPGRLDVVVYIDPLAAHGGASQATLVDVLDDGGLPHAFAVRRRGQRT